jgi:hypothetical protein
MHFTESEHSILSSFHIPFHSLLHMNSPKPARITLLYPATVPALSIYLCYFLARSRTLTPLHISPTPILSNTGNSTCSTARLAATAPCILAGAWVIGVCLYDERCFPLFPTKSKSGARPGMRILSRITMPRETKSTSDADAIIYGKLRSWVGGVCVSKQRTQVLDHAYTRHNTQMLQSQHFNDIVWNVNCTSRMEGGGRNDVLEMCKKAWVERLKQVRYKEGRCSVQQMWKQCCMYISLHMADTRA